MKLKEWLFRVVLPVFIVVAGVYFFVVPPAMHLPPSRTVEVAGRAVHVDVADTKEEREQGLSGRAGLKPDEGMLFVFERDGKYGFWMKDMLFPIDILWLSADGRVVYVVQSVAPETFPSSFAPEGTARYVLELPAGWAKAYNVQIGDIVRL